MPNRLRIQSTPPSLEVMGLVDGRAPDAFDAITRLASQLFQAPVALVSVVQEELDRQYFTSQVGLGEPWASTRQTPLSHSFCQHVKQSGQPLVVNDARVHELVKDNLAIPVLGVIAYLGVPIVGPDELPIGALCVIDSKPRMWTDAECALLTDLATCVRDEIQLRGHIAREKVVNESAQARNRKIIALTQAFSSYGLSDEARFTDMLRAACDLFGMSSAVLSRSNCDEFTPLYEVHADSDAPDLVPKGATAGAKRVAALQDCIAVHDTALWPDNPVSDIRCYFAHPLVINGLFFGVIEFYSLTPKPSHWSLDELSLLGMVASLVCAELSVFGKIEALKRSEDHLISQLYGVRAD